MTELEKVCVQKLIDDGTIKFYARYVDDTLLMIEDENVDRVNRELQKFDKNLKFTVDNFENEVPHFLDIEIAPDGLLIYRKPTQAGQYINYISNTPWRFKTSWISTLGHRAKLICSPNKLSSQLQLIRKYIALEWFPKTYLGNKLIKDTRIAQPRNTGDINKGENASFNVNLPYLGTKQETTWQILSA